MIYIENWLIIVLSNKKWSDFKQHWQYQEKYSIISSKKSLEHLTIYVCLKKNAPKKSLSVWNTFRLNVNTDEIA